MEKVEDEQESVAEDVWRIGTSEAAGEIKRPSAEDNYKEVLDAFNNPFSRISGRKRKRIKMNEEEFLRIRREKRVLEKQRKKAKRAAIKEAGGIPPKRVRPNLMGGSNCKQRVAIDMSFFDKMTLRDVNRTIAQLSFCYAANRRAKNPLQFTLAHLEGAQREIFDSNSTRHNWDVNISEEPLSIAFDSKDIVYLTADSDNVLNSLDPTKVYVIGGLLDHNAYKGICLELAKKNGFSHARLPIDEYVALNSRRVLTINQVFEILLHYTETGSWEQAFYRAIPKRKLDVETNKDKDAGPEVTNDNEGPIGEPAEDSKNGGDESLKKEDEERGQNEQESAE